MDYYLEDLRSDFSAIHHIPVDEIERMPAPRAFALAHRIGAYQGVMQVRFRAQHAKKTSAAASGPQEMKAGQWLAQNPRAVAGIARTKFDLTRRPDGVQDR